VASNKKPKKKYNPNKLKTNTPVNIRYTDKEALRLKLPPLASLMEFKTGKGTSPGRKTLEYRLHVGKELCISHFQEPLIAELDKAIATVQAVKDKYEVGCTTQALSIEDCEFIGPLLVSIDSMQDLTTRRDQLEVYRKVAAYCKD
jgi:hypothetical protein